MEKIVLDKLNEISKILMVALQKVEYLQKTLFLILKKSGRLPGLENKDGFNNIKWVESIINARLRNLPTIGLAEVSM